MGHITGGTFTYKRNVKDADYVGREFTAVINFSIENMLEEQSMLDRAREMATYQVDVALAIIPKKGGPAPVSAPAAKVAEEPKQAAIVIPADEPKKRPGRPPKTPKKEEADDVFDAAPKQFEPKQVDLEEAIAAKKAPSKFRPMSEKEQDIEFAKHNAAPATDDFLGDEPVKEYSDAELGELAMRTNTRIKNPGKVRKLIGEFVPDLDPMMQPTVKMVPQSMRAGLVNAMSQLGMN